MEKDKMILCDTDILIELYKNNAEVVGILENIGEEHMAASIVTQGELIYGALNKKELANIRKDLASINIIYIDKKTCLVFIDLMIHYTLSHRLSTPDGFIAATAIAYDLELFTFNKKDFKFIKGLKLFK